MSENRPPESGGDPTQSHVPAGNNEDELAATRLQPTVPPLDPAGVPAPAHQTVVTETRPIAAEPSGNLAQLLVVGLTCFLLGLGLGYLLFRDDGVAETPLPTTTTSLPVSTTTQATTSSSTTTTTRPTTTTTTKATTSSTTGLTTPVANSQG